MSDPVSNSEIEDVLASIRRLVSENARALKRDRERDPDADKLVLTPAHRIDESNATPSPAKVVAVDTETWDDTTNQPEVDENPVFFAHGVRRPEGAEAPQAQPQPPAEAGAAQATEGGSSPRSGAATEAGEDAADPMPQRGGADERRTAAGSDALTARAESAGPQARDAQGGATDSADLAASGHRISDPETTIEGDVRDSAHEEAHEEAHDGAHDGAGNGAHDSASASAGDNAIASEAETGADGAPAAPPAAAEAPAEAPVAATPPRSWIESLVAAAAAAEASRVAAMTAAANKTATETTTETRTETAPDSSSGAETADDAPATPRESTEGPLVLGAGPAQAAEPDVTEPLDLAAQASVGADGTDAVIETSGEHEPTAAEDTAERLSARESTAGESTEGPAGDGAEATGAADAARDGSDPLSGGAGIDGLAARAPGAEDPASAAQRSWVDRLVAAAAILRTAPAEADAQPQADGEGAGNATRPETADTFAEATEAAPDADPDTGPDMGPDTGPDMGRDTGPGPSDDTPDEAQADNVADDPIGEAQDAEVASAVEPLTLEPLNLVAPVVPGKLPEKEAAAGEGTFADATPEWEPIEPEAGADGAENGDTVLAGPWSAREAASAVPLDEAGDAKVTGAASLEWEEVEPSAVAEPEAETVAPADTAAGGEPGPEADTPSPDAQGAQDAGDASEEALAGDELGFAGIIPPEDVEFQGKSADIEEALETPSADVAGSDEGAAEGAAADDAEGDAEGTAATGDAGAALPADDTEGATAEEETARELQEALGDTKRHAREEATEDPTDDAAALGGFDEDDADSAAVAAAAEADWGGPEWEEVPGHTAVEAAVEVEAAEEEAAEAGAAADLANDLSDEATAGDTEETAGSAGGDAGESDGGASGAPHDFDAAGAPDVHDVHDTWADSGPDDLRAARPDNGSDAPDHEPAANGDETEAALAGNLAGNLAGPWPGDAVRDAAGQGADATRGEKTVAMAGALAEEMVIDEAMLRELVAQMVRDELQGTVGERITHNVRKLIRREIARALTLQEFEK